MKILSFFILIYLHIVVGVEKKEEFITIFSPKSVFEFKNHQVFLTTKNLKAKTEIGVQFKKINITVHAEFDDIKTLIFANKRSSGKYTDTDVIYTVLRNVSSKAQPQCSTTKSRIFYRKQHFFIFIQLDKPIYAPGDTVKFRVIVVDRDLKPYHMNLIDIRIADPFNRTMHEINDLKDMYLGVFSDQFDLSDTTPLGDWIISVVVDKQFDRNSAKIIPVKKYVLPLFAVHLDAAHRHVLENQNVDLTFFAKYPYGDSVTGNAEVKIMNANNIVYKSEKFYNFSDAKTVSYNIQKDLKITTENRTDIYATVIFTEPESETSENATIKLSVHKDSRRRIHVVHPTTFIRGLPFNTRIYPTDWKNETIYDDYEQVEITYTYKFDDGESSIDSNYIIIKKGVAIFRNKIPENTKSLIISAKFVDSKEYRVEVKPGNQYIRAKELIVEYHPKPAKLNDQITIFVGGVTNLDELIVAVMTRYGNVFSKNFHCDYKLHCEFNITVTDKMIPESTIVVYSVDDVNQFTYGKVILETESLGRNYLEVKPKISKQMLSEKMTVLPKKTVNLELNTTKDSKVYLMAFDKRLTFLRQGNEVSRRDVMKEISLFDSELEVVFDNLTNFHDCSNEELRRVSSGRKNTSLHSTSYDTNDIDDFDIPEDDQQTSQVNAAQDYQINLQTEIDENADENLREYFPESWLFEELVVSGNEIYNKSIRMPDSITSWIISSFAMHALNGIAIADPVEIKVKKPFFIKMMVPFSIRFKEVLQLNILAYNYVESNKPITVSITLENINKTIEFIEYRINGQSCKENATDGKQETIPNIIVPPLGVKKISFYIRSHHELNTFEKFYQNIFLRANAIANDGEKEYIDRVFRKLKVEQVGIKIHKLHPQSFRLQKTIPQKWTPIHAQIDERHKEFAKLSALVSSDYLSDIINLNTKMDFVEKDCLEQRTSKLKANIEYLNYMSGKNSKVHLDLNGQYQKILTQRNYGDNYYGRHPGGFSYSYKNGYIAYFIDTMASGMKIGAIPKDTNQIKSDLDRLQQNQASDGTFPNFGYHPEHDLRNTINDVYFETAYILVSILKHKDLVSKDYSTMINRSFSFLNSSQNTLVIDNEAMSVAAYAFALGKDFNTAMKFMENVEKYYKISQKAKCFKLYETSTSCHLRHTAYSALAYSAMNEQNRTRSLVLGLLQIHSINNYFTNSHQYVIAAEAISTLLKHLNTGIPEFFVTINNENNFGEIVNFNSKNLSSIAEVSLPEYSKTMKISTNGAGWCTVVVVEERITRVSKADSYFVLEIIPDNNSNSSIRNVEYCATYTNVKDAHIEIVENAMLEIEIPSGFKYVSMVDRENLSYVNDVISSRLDTLVVVYFGGYKKQTKYCVNLIISKIFDIVNSAQTGIKAYDYSNKDSVTVGFYRLSNKNCGA